MEKAGSRLLHRLTFQNKGGIPVTHARGCVRGAPAEGLDQGLEPSLITYLPGLPPNKVTEVTRAVDHP